MIGWLLSRRLLLWRIKRMRSKHHCQLKRLIARSKREKESREIIEHQRDTALDTLAALQWKSRYEAAQYKSATESLRVPN